MTDDAQHATTEAADNAEDDFIVEEFIRRDREAKVKAKAERDAEVQKGKFPPVKATPYRPRDTDEIPRRDYLYGKHYTRGYVSALFGAGGSGKTALEVVRILSMIVGRDLLRIGRRIKRPLRVWYVNLEDPRDDVELVFAAAMDHFGINQEQVARSLFLDSGRDQRFVVLKREGRSGVAVVAAVVDSVVEQAIAHRIDVIIVDPFVSSHTVEENNNTEMQQALDQWWYIADRAKVAVGLVHHVNKASSAMGDVIAESGRGGGAFKDKCRSVEVLNVMDAKQAEKFGIDPNDRFRYVRINLGKTNIAKMHGRADWFQLATVRLSQEPDDEVAVAAPWTPPSAAQQAGASAEHLSTIQGRLGEGRYREDVRAAKDWVGNLVAEVLGLDREDDKGKISTLIKAWVKDGKLRRVQRRNEGRKLSWYIEAPSAETSGTEADTEDDV